ncbi:ATP-binding protein [Acidovorax sp. MR-S7]|uniref:AAA family ATPase n=1 Tax=Acidovorax sp. MR-S7 TaxID=1268622 RepID=UPI0003D3D976|nr:ATP-binding protein [Acidovorax sp. MR-S7]GAD24278.1 ATPases of the AAA+ class [Acidovorax sp. MR-S7]
MRSIRSHALSPSHPPEPAPWLRLWLLRLLVPLGGLKTYLKDVYASDDTLATLLGMEIPAAPGEHDTKTTWTALRRQHMAAERRSHDAAVPQCLAVNVERLGKLVGLRASECRILEFTVLLHTEHLLEEVADFLGHNLSLAKVCRALTVLLDIPEPEVRQALDLNGILTRSGLMSLDRRGTSSLRGKLDLLSNSFADNMLSSEADPVHLLRGTVAPSPPAQLGLDDFQHIADSLSILKPYLRKTVLQGRTGVNIFVHGKPGTGKTELAKALAQWLGCELFEIASEDDRGDPADGDRRLRAFRAAQSFFARRRALLLFDEVEDVFRGGDSYWERQSIAQARKGWMNRMLDANPVPTLWLSNSIETLDPAFIRRFDMIVELPIPPKPQRERILHARCGDLLPPRHLSRIATVECLAPAVVTRASAVVRSIREELGEARLAPALEHLLHNTLCAQGHRGIKTTGFIQLPETYDPAFIHTDIDLAKIAEGLATTRSGRICLYGPPGTGKTAYARWLAEHLGAPLHARRASDIISMWVGETEKNLARAFRGAEHEGAVLLVDEVDSFLQDRRNAQHSWEVTAVNEMLTQMETFPGVFIASTNLMHGLDQAALRRFDIKARFGFLRPTQAWALLCRYATYLEIGPPAPELALRLERLTHLTPGDFAAVLGQHRLHRITSAAMLVEALASECALKNGGRTSIGFL